MRKLILVFSILYTVYGFGVSIAFAAEAATKSAALTEKINALKAEVASKAAALKAEVNKKLENKAYVGIISQLESGKIIITTFTGDKNVITNEYTSFQDTTSAAKKTKPKLESKDLKTGDYIASLGDVDDKESLIAKRIVKVKKPSVLPATFWGQINSVSNSTITIQSRDGNKISISTTPQTLFSLGREEASINDVKVNKFLSGVSTQIKDNKTEAKYIYLIPSSGYFKPDKMKVSTASASPSAKLKKN